jgi:chromosome segregation ATPase
MLRATFLFLSLVSFSSSASSQTVEPQTRAMEAVLSEIRQLRQDLQSAAVSARKAQIVIYRLHVQAALVQHATERLENVKNELAQLESERKYLTEQIKHLEEMKDRAETEQQRKQFEDYIIGPKSNLEAAVPREQELQAKQIELEADLRTEQAKWDRLQDELDRLENALLASSMNSRKDLGMRTTVVGGMSVRSPAAQ